MPRRAFTLLEVLVVVAIIAVLALVGVPAYRRYQEKGRATACMQHLRQLGAALNFYLADHQGIMPTLKLGREKITDDEPVIDNTLDRYLPDKKAFKCPSDERWFQQSGTSYHWNNALNGQSVASLNFMAFADTPGVIPVMGDKEGFHNDPDHKINILYADGRASRDLTFVTRSPRP
jgi:prepilin-type N-terminal cleavage/methylation domain-containing protein